MWLRTSTQQGLTRLSLGPAIFLLLCWPQQSLARSDYLGFDVSNASVPASSIQRGGPARDGIPALTDPSLAQVADFEFFDDDERVIGVAFGDRARAYPIRLLNWHEIVNDRLAGRNLVVSWCPLCGSGMVFDGGTGDERLVFGVSGLLYNSDVLMYDKRTESLWSQLMGEAISGPLLGQSLQLLPASNTTWGDWRRRYPKTEILSFNTGYHRDYGRDPYEEYVDSPQLYFAVSNRDDRYHPKAVVAGLVENGVARAWPLQELGGQSGGEFEDSFDGKPVRIRYDSTHRSVEIFDATGEPLPVITAYWFAWYAFYPETSVYKP